MIIYFLEKAIDSAAKIVLFIFICFILYKLLVFLAKIIAIIIVAIIAGKALIYNYRRNTSIKKNKNDKNNDYTIV